jgi:predicted MFS family arabinose efflux permease
MPFKPDAATRLVIVLGFGAGGSSLAGRAFEPLVNVVASEFMVAAATVALLSSAFALPYALIQPILGPVGDALGKMRVIRACLVVLGLALTACAFAPDLATLAVLRAVAGGAAGGIFPLAIALVGDRVPLERRQVALARLIVAGLSGAILGGALAAFAEPLIGWRGVMLVCASASIVGIVLLRDRAETPPKRLALAEAMARYRFILGQPAARACYLAVFIEGSLLHGVFPFLAPLFQERGVAAGNGAAEAGFAIAGYAVGGFLFAALAPALLRRYGQAWTIRAGGSALAAGLVLLAAAPGVAPAVLAMVVTGLGFYMIHSSIQTRVTEVAPQARGSAVALHAFSFFLGQSVGPVVMGTMRAAFGPVLALLVAAAGLLALAIWLAHGDRSGSG